MDAPTASIIAAMISAVASVAVALITTRARINSPPTVRDPSMPAPTQAEQPAAVQRFRVIGWALAGFLYLMGTVVMALGCYGLWWESIREGSLKRLPDLGVAAAFVVAGALFVYIGYWAQKRLRRRNA